MAISASVGGVLGSSCAMRLRTTGVYGASAATAGDRASPGNWTGSAYGTLGGGAAGSEPAPLAEPVIPATIAMD